MTTETRRCDWCGDIIMGGEEKCGCDAETEIAGLRQDAERYRWLRKRLMAADFDWQDSGECALVFAWPKDCAVSGNCDMTIDAAMLKTPNVEFRRGEALACNAGLGVEHPGKD